MRATGHGGTRAGQRSEALGLCNRFGRAPEGTPAGSRAHERLRLPSPARCGEKRRQRLDGGPGARAEVTRRTPMNDCDGSRTPEAPPCPGAPSFCPASHSPTHGAPARARKAHVASIPTAVSAGPDREMRAGLIRSFGVTRLVTRAAPRCVDPWPRSSQTARRARVPSTPTARRGGDQRARHASGPAFGVGVVLLLGHQDRLLCTRRRRSIRRGPWLLPRLAAGDPAAATRRFRRRRAGSSAGSPAEPPAQRAQAIFVCPGRTAPRSHAVTAGQNSSAQSRDPALSGRERMLALGCLRPTTPPWRSTASRARSVVGILRNIC
jgi:hypothetical protein